MIQFKDEFERDFYAGIMEILLKATPFMKAQFISDLADAHFETLRKEESGTPESLATASR